MNPERRRDAWRVAGLGLALAVLFASGPAAAKSSVASLWLDREITVDGELDEWRDALSYIKSVDAFVGAYNDGQSFYLCLYTQSPELAEQFVVDGLRVRLEGVGEGTWVVHYPLGSGRDATRRAPDREPAAADPGLVVELEIPGQRDRVAVSARGEAGIEAATSRRVSFVYELKIPLTRDSTHPWALGAAPGDRFKLVIENPQIDRADEQAARGRRRGATTPLNPGVGGMNGGGGDPGFSGPTRADDPFFENRFVFLLKTRVELARAP